MSNNFTHRLIAVMAAAVILIAAVLLIGDGPSGTTLTLTDWETGEVLLTLPARDGGRFSVTFVHSVNQTPVEDTFEIRGGDIYVVETRFYNFGAGMQTEYPEGVTWSYAEDGAIIATGYNIYCKDLIYCVGMVSDHILELDGEEYSLRELCGRGTMVEFEVRTGE